MNIPNLLTLIRILLIPVLVLFYCIPTAWGHAVAAIIFGIAALTDWLDGYLARNLDQGTRFGAFLDPVADKLMVAVALVLVVGEANQIWLSIPAAVIIAREILISGLREWMAEIGQRKQVSVNVIAKVKTTSQMLALLMLLFYEPDAFLWVKLFGLLLLYVSAILTLWSMVIYLKIAWSDLTLSTNQ